MKIKLETICDYANKQADSESLTAAQNTIVGLLESLNVPVRYETVNGVRKIAPYLEPVEGKKEMLSAVFIDGVLAIAFENIESGECLCRKFKDFDTQLEKLEKAKKLIGEVQGALRERAKNGFEL